MTLERPELLKLGGEEAFAAYRGVFNQRYRGQAPVRDVLDRQVVFELDACWHVCSQAAPGDTRHAKPRVWTQERAERILWIEPALTDAQTEIRPSHMTEGREVYLFWVPADPAAGLNQERFYVVVEPIDEARVLFVTAYPIGERYWNEAKRKGPRLYPPPKPPKPRRRKRGK
jgi:hypothetical protein